MKRFTWKPSYALGIPKIDDQHKQLVAMIDQLHQAAVNKTSRQELEFILSEATRYTFEHFSTEERLFVATSYPQTDSHKLAHRAFTEKIGEFKSAHEKGQAVLSIQVLVYLMDWLTHHICDVDVQFAEYLKNMKSN